MTTLGWIVAICWPVLVTVIYMLIVDGTLKQRAQVTTDHFHMVGKSIQIIDQSLKDMDERLRNLEASAAGLDAHDFDR